MAYIIAIANNKGGIGKTTSAVNLCCLWAHKMDSRNPGLKIGLIDNDPQGNCGVCLGVNTNDIKHTMREVYLGEKTLDDIKIKIDFDETLKPYDIKYPVNDFYLFHSGADLEDIQKFDGKKVAILQNALCKIDDQFDIIVIDNGPNLGFLARSAIMAADMVLIPTESEIMSIEGLKKLVVIINNINKKYDPKLIRTFINNISGEEYQVNNAKDISKWFKELLYKTPIPANKHLGRAKEQGIPVFLLEKLNDIKSPGAKAYRALSEEILSDLLKQQEDNHE
jgi:chromosome partitioning protein